MKKKFVSTLLAAVMVVSLAACGGESGNESSGEQSGEQSSEQSSDQSGSDGTENQGRAEVTPEALVDPFAHITFDEGADEGYTVVERAENEPGALDGATHGIVDSTATVSYADGPVGQAVYLDGEHALNLHLEPTNTDTYTVSYWMNADRVATYAPTLTMGYNMGKAADAGNDVTWFNVTQSEWGTDSAKIFPIVWSRNEASDAQDGTDCWPWMYAFDDQRHGIKEWVMVTIVCSGETQTGAAGTTTAGAQYYLNGNLVYDSADNYTNHTYWEEWTWDASLAPNIMKPGDAQFESWFGINYWDTIYKGFVDDLYVFDTALTPGQVLSLYQMGDPNVSSVAPEGAAGNEEEPQNPVVTITGTQLGAEDFTSGWWTTFSEGWEVPSGETVSKTFVNWHGAEASNWNNFVIVLQSEAVSPLEKSADCVEYAVLRADNWGWKMDGDTQLTTGDNLDTLGWTVESDWNWDTFAADLQGATVTVSVTNNGDTADVECQITTAAGDTHFQNYKNIAINDGALGFCLTVDSSMLDIQ